VIEQDLLSGALSLAQSRLIEAQHQLAAAQRALRPLDGAEATDDLPLPGDLPLADEYVTHFSVFADRGMFDPRLGQIDARLPQTLEVIQSRATASAKCRTVAAQAIGAFNQNQLPLASALEAIRMCRECDNEFIRAIGEYNRDVADYAMAVAPFGQSVRQVVGMLIKPSPLAESPARTASNLTSVPQKPQSVMAPTTSPKQSPQSFENSFDAVPSNGNWSDTPQVSSAADIRQPSTMPVSPSRSILSTVPPGAEASNQGVPPALSPSAATPLRPQMSGGGQFNFDKR
jgi:hypothetical protein